MSCKYSTSGLRWLWISVIVIALDRISKMIAVKYLSTEIPFAVMPSFNFILSFNKGSAFGFLNSASGWQVWMFGAITIFVSIAILIWLSRLKASQKWLSIALALVIGGALGNLLDRFIYGHVVDFIQWYVAHFYWPVFNLADSAICIGAVMLFIDTLFRKHP